jgi:hypothetical protein
MVWKNNLFLELESYRFSSGCMTISFMEIVDNLSRPSAPDIKNLPVKEVFYVCVLEVGLEPTTLARHDFESCAYTIPPLQQY